ncbi:MAG: ketopantoate reductase family protein [Peptococcaceae bacterium]|nr:ketopantoate reductase family protein [Peptococcaceae bacterium]
MRIVVIGAGAVGGYFGGRLAEAGLDVTFLVRAPKAAKLRKDGLVIKSPSGDLNLTQVRLAVEAQAIEGCELVLVAVKSYQLNAAMPQIITLANSGAKILPLLNGVEHYELLRSAVGAENVLGGLCQIVSTLDAEGNIQHTSAVHSMTFGPTLPSQVDFCAELKQAWSNVKFACKLSDDIWVDIWAKYAFITAFSGVTTASRLSIDKILAVTATKDIYYRSLQEMWQLARVSSAVLPDDYVNTNVETVSKNLQGATSSMHQDLRKGLTLEVESLQGAALRLAAQSDLELPTIRTLYGLIKPYENGAAGLAE